MRTIKSAVYIPTRRRIPYLLRAVEAARKALGESETPIIIAADNQEIAGIWKALEKSNWTGEVQTLAVKPNNKGIGYARKAIMKDAENAEFETIAMIDDDQIVRGDLPGLLRIAARADVTGVGAYEGIHGLFSRGTEMVKNHKEPGTWLHSGSLGYHTWALNVDNVQNVCGGFDPKLRFAEDVELARESYRCRGVPWMIYTGATTSSMLKHNPGPEFGGVAEKDRTEGFAEMHRIVYPRWPDFVSAPPAKYRCSWKKLAETYLATSAWPLENIRTEIAYDWEEE
jgi:hypothetical protein